MAVPGNIRPPSTPAPWKHHARTTLLNTPSFRIHRDHVTRPDGSEGAFEFHQSTEDGAVTVAEDDQGRIALVRYSNYVHGELLTPPGGSLEPGEDPLQAAQRELREEAGITAAHWTRLGEAALTTRCTARLHIYAARGLTIGRQQLTSTEAGMAVEWWPLAEAVAAAIDSRLLLSGAALSVLLYAHPRTR